MTPKYTHDVVTVSGFSSRCGTFISVCDKPSRSTQPGHPFVGRRNEYQPKGAMTPCGWRVKAGMVRMWVAGKTVWSHCYTRAISERFRDKWLIIKCYINSSVYRKMLTCELLAGRSKRVLTSCMAQCCGIEHSRNCPGWVGFIRHPWRYSDKRAISASSVHFGKKTLELAQRERSHQLD